MILPTESKTHRLTTKDGADYVYRARTNRLDPNEYFRKDYNVTDKSILHLHKKTHNDGVTRAK